jgi:hypothetical protein
VHTGLYNLKISWGGRVLTRAHPSGHEKAGKMIDEISTKKKDF